MSPAATTWRVGTATSEFPVEPGTPMGGYAARTGPSAGTLDPLTVSALALAAGDRELVIVSADVVAVDEALTQKIAAKAGIPRSSLLLAASHTHSGPAGISHELHPASSAQIDHALRGRFAAICAKTITRAQERLLPAILSIGQLATAGLASNRNDPAGAYDPTMTVLSARDEAGLPISVVVHWACHPTTLGAKNRLISADFPGTLRSHLRNRLAPATPTVMYLNGAAGDVSNRFTRQDQSSIEVDRIGSALADAAVRAMGNGESIVPRIERASAKVQLAGWTQDEISATLSTLSDMPEGGQLSNEAIARLSVTRAQGLDMLRALAESPCRPRRRSVRMDAWRLGDWVILGIPGELIANLGQEIVSSSPAPVTMVGYAGGYVGYLPDRGAYDSGTYEALASAFGPGSGEKVAEAAVALFRELST